MSTVELIAHKSRSYVPRTYENAHSADFTLAFAFDFSTAGEKLTEKAAGERFMGIKLPEHADNVTDMARYVYRALRHYNAHKLNIAGNGLYTAVRFGWTQQMINQYVYDVLKVIKPHWEIASIRSGGQTGADHAGLVAAYLLGIPAIGLYPAGFRTRNEFGIDVCYDDPEELKTKIILDAGLINL